MMILRNKSCSVLHWLFFTLVFLLFGVKVGYAVDSGPAADRARLIVLADMGNEPDEEQQMLHLLMCSNELDIEGLIAVTGRYLRPEDKRPYRQRLHPELYHQLIDGYEKVYPNLKLHAANWPRPESLRRVVVCGQRGYGVGDIGKGHVTSGSQLIISAVTKPDPRPIFLAINAGSNTLAQALWDYRAGHSDEEMKAFVAKLRVYENQAQDDAGAWICHEFPDIHWVRSRIQTRCYGGPNDADMGPYQWKPFEYSVHGQDAWANEHVRVGHGTLGALYPTRVHSGKVHFIEGGGTIPWMALVCPGLTDLSEPSWGGWSGRYTRDKKPNIASPIKGVAVEEKKSLPFAVYTDVGVKDRWVNPEDGKAYYGSAAAIWPWRVAMWNDFKARMDWCRQPYDKANHHPQAVINGDGSDMIVRHSGKVGEVMAFNASGSSDPDKDTLAYRWWIYPEAGRRPYGKDIAIDSPTAEKIRFTIPTDASGKELHLILEVWDQSTIVPLVDYRRVVISVD